MVEPAVGQSCSLYGGQEAERERGRGWDPDKSSKDSPVTYFLQLGPLRLPLPSRNADRLATWF